MSTHAIPMERSRMSVASFVAAVSVVLWPLIAVAFNALRVFLPAVSLAVAAASVGPLLAVTFGIIALREIRRSNGLLGGRGLAWAGLILGIVEIVAGVLVVVAFVLALNSFQF